MYVVSGVSGQTGSSAAEALLAKGLPVRVIVRDAAKGEAWTARGAEVAVADLKDPAALTQAFTGAAAAYVLNPPAYRAPDMFAEARTIADSIKQAAIGSQLPKLVLLSSVGAERADKLGSILTNRILEQALGTLTGNLTIIRASFFMDNWLNVLGVAKEQGILPSFIQPLDRKRPTVSSVDIGRTAADAMLEQTSGHTQIELEGPDNYSPDDVAAALGRALDKPVRAIALPREQWPEVVSGFGFSPVTQEAYIEMMESNNAGLFQPKHPATIRHGSITLDQAVASWLAR